MRIGGTAVAVLLLAVCAPESLAAKQVCRIVQDARGDAEYPADGVPGDDGDDLLSADLASDGKQLTAVWRLAALRELNPAAPLGQDFVAYFQAFGSSRVLYVDASTATTPPSYRYGYVDTGPASTVTRQLGVGKGILDRARGEARMTVPTRGFSSVGARITKGTRLRSINVLSSRVVTPAAATAAGAPEVWLTFDSADGRSYVVGTPSCARPVR